MRATLGTIGTIGPRRLAHFLQHPACHVCAYSFYAWLGAKNQRSTAERRWARAARRATGVVLIAAGALAAFAKA
jgi:threonine/homoserine/homoserine lactone efflux protein